MDDNAGSYLKTIRAAQMADIPQRLGKVASSRHTERGIVALEFALILPLLLTITLSVIEFGFLMVKYEVVASAVASMANQIHDAGAIYSTNVAPAYNTTPTGQQNDANNSGGGLIGFGGAGGAYICAQTYDNLNSEAPNNINALPANPANYCTQGSWVTGGDQALTAPVTSGSYTVAIYAYIPPHDITPFPSLGISTLMLNVAVGKTFQMGGPVATAGGITGGCSVGGALAYYPANSGASSTSACPYGTWCVFQNWGTGCQPWGYTTPSNSTVSGFTPCLQVEASGYSCGMSGSFVLPNGGTSNYGSFGINASGQPGGYGFCKCYRQ